MASCVIALTMDSETGRSAPACNVHCTFDLPCRHDGKPASDTPMHTCCVPSRADAVEFWRKRTLGQRNLVIHRGSFAGADHTIDETWPAACWCGVELITGRDITDRCPACTCDPVLCETDDSGASCADCGACLHGCPLDGNCPEHKAVR
jgi:hypothetical protein